MLLVGWQEWYPACKKSEWWGTGVVVWSEVQMICIWSSWCQCHPIISCSIKIQNGLPFTGQLLFLTPNQQFKSTEGITRTFCNQLKWTHFHALGKSHPIQLQLQMLKSTYEKWLVNFLNITVKSTRSSRDINETDSQAADLMWPAVVFDVWCIKIVHYWVIKK